MSANAAGARLRAILGVAVMGGVLVIYFVLVGIRAVALLGSEAPIAVAMGVALLVLPLLGCWALGRELLFGYKSTQLADRLDEEGRLPEELVAIDAGSEVSGSRGRSLRDQAGAVFPSYKAAAEAEPESWRAWMRLGIVYDAAGDRKRGRAAIRQAIALAKTA